MVLLPTTITADNDSACAHSIQPLATGEKPSVSFLVTLLGGRTNRIHHFLSHLAKLEDELVTSYTRIISSLCTYMWASRLSFH